MISTHTLSHTPDGRQVLCYDITRGDLRVTVFNLGPTIQKIVYDGVDVVCGYDDIFGYLNNGGYVGTTVGRYANRIAKGKFTLNGITYDVGCNETNRGGHLHGGTVGFNAYSWTGTVSDDYTVRFFHSFPDGDMGYPGKVDVTVTFALTEDGAVSINYYATTDRDTVINLTNHTYFNLNGFDGGDVLNTLLTIRSDAITPVDEHLIPTGECLPVAGTPFDFRQPKPIGQDIDADHPQIKLGGGYDHNYVLTDPGLNTPSVVAHSPKTGITMTCCTDQPAVQLYTGNKLNADDGKNGILLYPHQGFCLETQHFPDSPNHPDFPSTVLRPGVPYDTTTVYRFSKE